MSECKHGTDRDLECRQCEDDYEATRARNQAARKAPPEYKAHGMTLPAHMQEAITRYVQFGDRPGHFLTAVLENNLKEAVGRADGEMLKIIPVFVVYLYNEVDARAWGSKEKVNAWVDLKWHEAQTVEAERALEAQLTASADHT